MLTDVLNTVILTRACFESRYPRKRAGCRAEYHVGITTSGVAIAGELKREVIQCSICTFQLYNEVQARRGGNSVTAGNHQNINDGPGGNHGDGIFTPAHQSNRHRSDGRSYPAGHQNGVSEIGDLLQDYLDHGKHANRKNNGARHVVSTKNKKLKKRSFEKHSN